MNAIRTKQASTKYSHLNQVDKQNKYELNCSGLVNYLLMSENLKNAITEIRQFIIDTNDYQSYRNGHPRALQFVRFLRSHKERFYWEKIEHVQDMKPGDIIAYAHETSKITKSGQHVMIVSELPKPFAPQWLKLMIIDSSGGHGMDDTRGVDGGIGEGEIALEVNDSGSP